MQSLLLGVLLAITTAVAVGAAAALVACARLSYLAEALLAIYVAVWCEIVGLLLVLSAFHAATRGWVVAGVAVLGVLVAIAWIWQGRPRLPPVAPAISGLRAAAGDRLVGVAAIAFILTLLYCTALAVLTPANEGDTLAYHLARAMFWAQDHAVGYVANPTDGRLGPNPPNAEIGQLFTMLLGGSDRFVALPQLIALPVVVAAVYATARRVTLQPREALYGALLFGLLPVVVLQSSTALNDLVAASFIVVAAPFALAPERRSHLIAGLAVALAVGTKSVVPVLVVPLLLVVIASQPSWRRLEVTAALIAGVLAGSYWSVENLHVTGRLDGGLAEGQISGHAPADALANLGRLARRALDLPGLEGRNWGYFVVASALLAAAGLVARKRRRREMMRTALGAALVVAAVPVMVAIGAGLAGTGQSRSVADATGSWYGPAGLVAVLAATAILASRLQSGTASIRDVLLASAPLIQLVLLAVALTYDPYRGRFLMSAVALSASTWGVLLARRWLALGTMALALLTTLLSLQTFAAKPAGSVLGDPNAYGSTWGAPRWLVQTWLRPDGDERAVLRFFERHVPDSATVALAVRPNDFLSPYFGAHLTRTVRLVPDGYAAPDDAGWIVIAPTKPVELCLGDWRQRFALRSGWRVLRRVASDSCPT